MVWKGESRRHSLARRGIKTVIDKDTRFDVSKFVAKGLSNRAIFNLITEVEWNIWSELGIKSGSQLRENINLQEQYVLALDQVLPIDTKLPAEIYFMLEDMNHHTLNDYLLRENKFEPDQRLWGYRDNEFMRGYDTSLKPFYEKNRPNWYSDNMDIDEWWEMHPEVHYYEVTPEDEATFQGTKDDREIVAELYLSQRLKASGWNDKLQNVYSNYDEFKSYSDIYGIHKKLGFSNPEEAWEDNPHVKGSTNPAEYGLHNPVFDISTEKGIERAEKYKKWLENNYEGVETKMVGIDKVKITGKDR